MITLFSASNFYGLTSSLDQLLTYSLDLYEHKRLVRAHRRAPDSPWKVEPKVVALALRKNASSIVEPGTICHKFDTAELVPAGRRGHRNYPPRSWNENRFEQLVGLFGD